MGAVALFGRQRPARGHPSDLVLRAFPPDAEAVATRWCGDITCIATDEGWLYLAIVIDIAFRRVVGRSITDHMRTELVADARRARRPAGPVISHSDRGCQYTSREFATALPKGAMRTHRALAHEYESAIEALDLAEEDRPVRSLPLYG